MYADSLDELRQMMDRDPDASPSLFLRDDSFAAWCYDRLSVVELCSAFERDADPGQCRQWGLTATQWKDQVAMALAALKASG